MVSIPLLTLSWVRKPNKISVLVAHEVHILKESFDSTILNMQNDLIKEYNRIAESIGAYFCAKYFRTDDFYFVADDRIDGPLYVNDYWFSLDDMLNYMRYKYTVKKMFEHYDYALEEKTKDEYPICIRDWKKLK